MCEQIDSWTLPNETLVVIRLFTLPLALIFNPLCIILLLYKAKVLLRSYKHLLICVCLIDALFSILYFVTGPTPIIVDSSIYMLNCGSFAEDPTLNRLLLHALFCLLAVSGYTLTILFIYRCTHICTSHYLYIFQSRWFWIFVSVGFAVMISLAENVAAALSGEFTLTKLQNETIIIAYIAIHPYNQDNKSSVPIICCYIPFIFVLLSANFIVGLQKVAAISLLFSAWYPVLDPLLVIYFVVDYRRIIRGCLSRLKTITKSQVRVRAASYVENSF
ncbi:unnamed protein product, partial [Mesorhabditis belari]|uniref:G protein-coupled receptor n=1 Tax=Mesorhabditis belari TaxID=2138241 RepID=A0AAF3J9E9_9BILA